MLLKQDLINIMLCCSQHFDKSPLVVHSPIFLMSIDLKRFPNSHTLIFKIPINNIKDLIFGWNPFLSYCQGEAYIQFIIQMPRFQTNSKHLDGVPVLTAGICFSFASMRLSHQASLFSPTDHCSAVRSDPILCLG